MSSIAPRVTRWLVPGLLPRGSLTVLVGEEGIGKGLWWVNQVAELSRDGFRVVVVTNEDHPEYVLRPRLDVVGADTDRVDFLDRTRGGVPLLPTHFLEVGEELRAGAASALVVDPWISVVPTGLRVADTQQARAAIDPLAVLAEATSCAVLAVVHPNRLEGTPRQRVGLTAALRQAARMMLWALEDPDDENVLLVGVEKSNSARRAPAERFVKAAADHPDVGETWKVTHDRTTDRTISQWHDLFTQRARDADDGRRTERWDDLVQRADSGMFSRADAVEVYEGHAKSADKALARWVGKKWVVRHGSGAYEITRE